VSLKSMLDRAKDLVSKAKRQADMNLSMFGRDDADKVAYAQGVADGIASAMKEIVVEPFETRMGVRIVYIDLDGKVLKVFRAVLCEKLPFKLAKGDTINIEGDAIEEVLAVNQVTVSLHARRFDVIFHRLVISNPAKVANRDQQMASLAALGWMVREIATEEEDKSPW